MENKRPFHHEIKNKTKKPELYLITEFLDNDDIKYYVRFYGLYSYGPCLKKNICSSNTTYKFKNNKKIELKHLTQQIRIRKKAKKLKLKTCKMGKYYKLKSESEKKKTPLDDLIKEKRRHKYTK